MSHWENQENSLSAARILSDLLLLNSKSMAKRKEQLAYKAIIGPLLGVVWGGYEECCGHRKEVPDLFQWVKEQKSHW